VWPWLVGAGVLALLATSSSKGATAPAYTSNTSQRNTSQRSASTSRAVATTGPSNVPLTAANIQKAAAVALAQETNVSNLETFGKALYIANYGSLGVPLIVKALRLSRQAVNVASILKVLNIYQGVATPAWLTADMQKWMGGTPAVTTSMPATKTTKKRTSG